MSRYPYPYDDRGVPQPYYGGSLSEHMAAGARMERYLAAQKKTSRKVQKRRRAVIRPPRRRGGATMQCPSCDGRTRVKRTRRVEPDLVVRERRCVRKRCGHEFETRETR